MLHHHITAAVATAALAFTSAPAAAGQDAGGVKYAGGDGGTSAVTQPPADKPQKPRLLPNGRVTVPAGLPAPVRAALRAGNRLIGKPYKWGGGHGSFQDSGYDCSGTVSYVLRAAGALKAPMASGALQTWGQAGKGQWITVYANSGHAWMTVAGVRMDTSAADDPGGAEGPRWRADMTDTAPYTARSPNRL
jgi:hypothetical protein